MKPKLKVWIVFPSGTKFGEGRAELLRLVGEEGSLKRAVERMGMSYRAAWGYFRELEKAAGFPFLEREGGGARLTPRARAFLAAYGAYDRAVGSCAARAFRAAFPAASPRGPRLPRGRRPASPGGEG